MSLLVYRLSTVLTHPVARSLFHRELSIYLLFENCYQLLQHHLYCLASLNTQIGSGPSTILSHRFYCRVLQLSISSIIFLRRLKVAIWWRTAIEIAASADPSRNGRERASHRATWQSFFRAISQRPWHMSHPILNRPSLGMRYFPFPQPMSYSTLHEEYHQ